MLNYLTLRVCGIDIKPKYPFIGSTIRGIFGYALRQVCCVYVNFNCKECEFKGSCAYFSFYENEKTPNFKLNIKLNQPNYDFEIYLFENAIKHLKPVIIAIKNMPSIGLGVKKLPFSYKQIFLNQSEITNAKIDDITPTFLTFTPHFKGGNYELKTITPLRIKQKNIYVKNSLDFAIFIRQIAMKFGEITGEEQPKFEVHFDKIEQNFSFYDITRYSNRKGRKMEFGGIFGSMKIYGLDERSANFLELATLTNIGKSVTFGLGKVSVRQLK